MTLTRGFGQSALSVVSLAMIGKWFRRRLTTRDGDLRAGDEHRVHGGVSAGRCARAIVWMANRVGGDRIVPGVRSGADCVAVRSIDARIDWRGSGRRWRDVRRTQQIAGAQATLGEALRSPAFWVFALASAVYGLVASGIGLLNESILVERGFTPDIYYQALAVTAITGLLGNFAAGALAGRTSLRTVLVTALLVLAAGLTGLAHVTTVAQVMAQAVAMGIAGGFIMVVFFAFWGRAYGRAHLGRIQGAAQALTVVASAVGPLFLAMWSEATGSYALAFYVLAVVVAVLAIAAATVTVPAGARATG